MSLNSQEIIHKYVFLQLVEGGQPGPVADLNFLRPVSLVWGVSLASSMADVIDSKGGDKLLPPRMQRSGGQRFLLEDGELIQQSATTVTTGESSSKQDNKNKGFLSKLQTFKLKFDQLDQERASHTTTTSATISATLSIR